MRTVSYTHLAYSWRLRFPSGNPPLDKEAAIKRAEDFLKGTLNAMNMQVEIKASFDEEGTLNIDLNGDEMGVLIGKRGQTLDSVQYLTSLVVNKGNGPYAVSYTHLDVYKRQTGLEALSYLP